MIWYADCADKRGLPFFKEENMKNSWIKRLMAGALVIGLVVAALPVWAQDGELTETFTTEDGSLSFNYPAGWHAEGFMFPGIALVGTSVEAVESMTGDYGELAEGEVVIAIVSPQSSGMMLEGEKPTTLEEALELLIGSGDDYSEFSEPEELTLAGYPALLVEASGPDGDGIGLVMEFDGRYAVVTAMAAAGTYDDHAEMVLAILDTLVFAVPEGVITYEAETVDLSFDYPAGWVIFDIMDENSFIVLNEMYLESTPGSGQVAVYIHTLAALEMYGVDPTAAPDVISASIAYAWLSDQQVEWAEPENVTIGDKEGVKLSFVSDLNEGYALLLSFGDETLMVWVMAAAGELANFEADVTALVESLAYTPAE
jgi:hypothetical protein